ncbi:hypothetical protein BDD43_3316 [Mucilaginibacter gracilis]|uniref:Uncharacterized protein n=1 Tax=Mucilaginibacter gracilis TaxID=423350 RepID=A0A495J449_9SPHI|nr:hypothetical protein [Mucilaginibacter gracilis]RKR83114.1 hypothetical protein BDD43_3316 [Mucilaginibacter gracilis]
MEKTTIKWRLATAIILTSLGFLYYLAFVLYLMMGIPVDKVHAEMTNSWPSFLADYVSFLVPVFLMVSLYFWYTYSVDTKPQKAAEPEYFFEFKKVEKPALITRQPQTDFERVNIKASGTWQAENGE